MTKLCQHILFTVLYVYVVLYCSPTVSLLYHIYHILSKLYESTKVLSYFRTKVQLRCTFDIFVRKYVWSISYSYCTYCTIVRRYVRTATNEGTDGSTEWNRIFPEVRVQYVYTYSRTRTAVHVLPEVRKYWSTKVRKYESTSEVMILPEVLRKLWYFRKYFGSYYDTSGSTSEVMILPEVLLPDVRVVLV